MLAFALRADGWYLRSEIIWEKSNPSSIPRPDRPTSAHETIFLLSKSKQYFSDGMTSLRSVWRVACSNAGEKHSATMPTEIARRCILAGCPVGGTVLDPFSGAGTTALVAARLQRHAIGIELSADYVAMSERRIVGDAPLFNLGGAE